MGRSDCGVICSSSCVDACAGSGLGAKRTFQDVMKEKYEEKEKEKMSIEKEERWRWFDILSNS
jgi:hypothetical protein